MYKDKNELYKDVALEVTIDAKRGAKNQEIKTHATFYSYDVQSGLIKINIKKAGAPMPLPNGTQILISAVKLDLPQQKMVFTGDIVDNNNGIAHWIIPDKLQGYKGDIRAGVFIKLPNNQRLHGGYFRFHMGISEIDENLVPFEENYWQGWHDFQQEAEKEWNAWKVSRDKTWREHEEAYNEWKKQQENKQTQYENDTDERWNKWKNQQEKAQSEFESNFVSWKSTQGNKQKQFENDFQSWKDTQVNKQTEFEGSTNEQLKGITEDVNNAEDKVADLEKNLDVEQKNYFSTGEVNNLAFLGDGDSDKIAEHSDYRGYSLPVSVGEVYSISRSSKTNNRFRIAYTSSEPKNGTVYFGSTSDKYDNALKAEGLLVPEDAEYMVVYLSNNNDELPNIMLNKGETSARWVPNADDLATKQELDKKIEDKAEKSEITDLNNKVENYYDNLFETEVLYDGMEDNLGLYFDESHSFSIDQNKKVEKVVFWWSRYDIGNAPKNYAFNNTIVDGETLRILQKKESTMRVPFKPTEADTTSFKNIDFIKKGVKGSTKNTQSNVGDRDNRWIVLRKLYVVYRKEV